ncbi:hypothetical protein BAU23_19460 [Bacillus nitratireducens]|nr:hypothetical protein BAU23_19460 [Bacillus nitratireducens]
MQKRAPLSVDGKRKATPKYIIKVDFGLNPRIRNRLNGLYMTIFFLGGAFGSWIGSYTYYKFNSEVTLLIHSKK